MPDFQHGADTELSYSRLKQAKLPLVIGPCIVATYLAISYLHPANNQWLFDGSFEWKNFLQFVFIDQIGIELVTYFILARLVAIYGERLKSFANPFKTGLSRYLVSFLPLFLVAFFFINPFTQTLRYFYHEFPNWNYQLYVDEYFYSVKLYLIYLPPLVIGGYASVAANLYFNVRERDFRKSRDQLSAHRLEVIEEAGKSFIDPRNIVYIQRVNRRTMAFTEGGSFRINHSLEEMDGLLRSHSFFRISRSVIVNLSEFRNYSFWENDKYVLRLRGGKEFIFSRDRLSGLRERLG